MPLGTQLCRSHRSGCRSFVSVAGLSLELLTTPWTSCASVTSRSMKQQQVEEEAELTQAGPSYLDVGGGKVVTLGR